MTDFVVYDVFTDRAFGGNPLAVIPDARGLSDTRLSEIAREFNFSESTFVYPPDDPSHDAKVRILTPAMELPFAGHPIVGTALALRDLGLAGDRMVLELGVGPIPVTIADGEARFVTHTPFSQSAAPPVADVARLAGLSAEAIRVDNHAPLTAGVGVDYVLAELSGPAVFASATPVADAFREVGGEHPEQLALLVYLRDGASIRARMFWPFAGVMEDPATGSAAAALAAWLGRLDGVSAEFEITQGVEMGRPSLIRAGVTVEAGEPVAVAISGRAVKIMGGRLTL